MLASLPVLRRFNTLPIKVRFALGVVVLPFLAYGATAGCSAYQRPPDLTSQEQALLAFIEKACGLHENQKM